MTRESKVDVRMRRCRSACAGQELRASLRDCAAAPILTFLLVNFDFAWLKLRNTPCQQLIPCLI